MKRSESKRSNSFILFVDNMLAIDPNLIITGDFNTKEEGIQLLAEQFGLEVMTPEFQEDVGTTHANNRYDHFLISPDLHEEAVMCRIITYSGKNLDFAQETSDHLPILAWFRTYPSFRD
ncbi:MAG: hypothetical protein KAW14_03580 [Candidatus Aegiribacteria sp.]|nr:hypothetical protein [Candidatus Aegiribacteria sp.]